MRFFVYGKGREASSKNWLTNKQWRFLVIVNQGRQHEQQRMAYGNPLLIAGRVVVYNHFAEGSFFEYFLALPRGGEVGQGGLSLLQPPPVEPVRAVDVDGPRDVVHVVAHEGPAVQEDVWLGPRPAVFHLGLKGIVVQGLDVVQHQGPLEVGTLGARAGGQADAGGLQFESFRGTQRQMGGWCLRTGLTDAPVQRKLQAVARSTTFEANWHDASV